MSSSLIPERPLLVSPSLAATIGLEEACMLSLLSDIATYAQLTARDGMNWLHLDENLVRRVMPFWAEHDIQRISKNLRDKGIIILDSAPYVESRCLTFAFNETQATPKTTSHKIPSRKISIGQGANLISPHWQPDSELLKKIAEHNIPDEFIREKIPEFVTYWRERGETHHSWGAKFLQDLIHKWRHHETQTGRQQRDAETDFIKRDQEIAMHNQWRPSQDALEVLVKHASISLAFVEDAIPEFMLYWQERGDVGRTWNSKFIQHVKRQWVRYNSALEHDTEPRRIPDNWQPSNDLFDVLRLANIDMEFAKRQVAEFLLFWRDSNQLFASWNTKFLQHVKFHWAKQHALTTMTSSQGSLQGSLQGNHHAGQQLAHPTGRTRDRSLAEQLNDRSWAQ
jgi:hypothetical protein